MHLYIWLYLNSKVKDLCLKAPLSVQQYSVSGVNDIRETKMKWGMFPVIKKYAILLGRFKKVIQMFLALKNCA